MFACSYQDDDFQNKRCLLNFADIDLYTAAFVATTNFTVGRFYYFVVLPSSNRDFDSSKVQQYDLTITATLDGAPRCEIPQPVLDAIDFSATSPGCLLVPAPLAPRRCYMTAARAPPESLLGIEATVDGFWFQRLGPLSSALVSLASHHYFFPCCAEQLPSPAAGVGHLGTAPCRAPRQLHQQALGGGPQAVVPWHAWLASARAAAGPSLLAGCTWQPMWVQVQGVASAQVTSTPLHAFEVALCGSSSCDEAAAMPTPQ